MGPDSDNPGAFNWADLAELRAAYLAGTAGAADYWSSDSLVAGYDATFARRIAWKWAHVFRELDRLNWRPPAGAVHDWGCGTGVAVREWLANFGTGGVAAVHLTDRSARALRFAGAAVQREYPEMPVHRTAAESPALLLISHVLTELNESQMNDLTTAARKAQCVVVVEPGTKDGAARVVRLRERLRDEFNAAAPCMHNAPCGMLAAGRERDWCHFFASPPSEVFMDAGWNYFGREMGIDLRALPLSWLVLDRRPAAAQPPGTVRMTGSPRIYKGYAILQGCDAAGVHDRRFSKRTDGAFFRKLGKGRAPTRQKWTLDGDEITDAGG